MDIKFNQNEDHNKLLVSDLRQRLAKVKLGGGEKRIAKLNLIKYLLNNIPYDDGQEFYVYPEVIIEMI